MRSISILLLVTPLLTVGCEQPAERGAGDTDRRSTGTRGKEDSTMRSRTITVSIARPAEDVYAFVADESNLGRWLTFVTAVKNVDGQWLAETAQGPMTFRFVEKNDFGVLDHSVRLPSGAEVLNPMRVIGNGTGSEVIFTLFHRPEMSDEEFTADAATVETDLQNLKHVLEN